MRKLLSCIATMLLLLAFSASSANAQPTLKKGAPSLSAKMTAAQEEIHPVFADMMKRYALPNKNISREGIAMRKTKAPAYASMRNAMYAPMMAPKATDIYGIVIADEALEYEGQGWVAEFNNEAAGYEKLAELSFSQPDYMIDDRGIISGTRVEDKYYAFAFGQSVDIETYARHYEAKALTFNAETWELEEESYIDSFAGYVMAMAYSPIDEVIYAFGYDEYAYGYIFGTYNVETKQIDPISSCYMMITTLGIGSRGEVYGMSDYGDLLQIDPETGDLNVIANTGLSSDYRSTGAVDAKNSILYYMMLTDNGTELWAVDVNTGSSVLCWEDEDFIVVAGSWIDNELTAAEAPAEPVINDLEYVDNSLTGYVNFTTPETLFDGSAPAAGAMLNFEILANGEVVKSGSNIEYGNTYRVQATVPESGLYKFQVKIYNEKGENLSLTKTKYIGDDAPMAPENVVLAYVDGKMELTWDAVDTAEHDGYLGAITYVVYDAEGNVVAQNLTETTASFEMEIAPELTVYQYSVAAASEGIVGAATKSNPLVFGALEPPYSVAFSEKTDGDIWDVYDVNGDGKTWTYVTQGDNRYIGIANRRGMEDYLVSPKFMLKENYQYEISFDVKAQYSYYGTYVEILAGPSYEELTDVVVPQTYVKNTSFETLSGKFTAPADGDYVIAIKATSTWNFYYLMGKDFSISAGINALVPAACSDLTVMTPYDGTPQASISYVAPTKNVAGDDLASLDRIEVLVDGQIIFVDNDPIMGGTNTCVFDAPADGRYLIEVIAYNEYGAGVAASRDIYLGVNVPGAPENITLEEVEEGVVKISWEAPEYDVDGALMNPAFVSYYVLDAYGNVIADDIKETSFTYQAVPAGYQSFVYYYVFSASEAGIGEYGFTDMVAVGTPDPTPWVETFADQKISHAMAIEYYDEYAMQYMDYGIVGDSYFSDLKSRSGDNGYWIFTSDYAVGSAALFTGKINIGAKDPDLTFYYLAVDEDDSNEWTISVMCDGEMTELDTFACEAEFGWHRHQVDLKDYAGKEVQIYFIANFGYRYSIMGLDDIRIGEKINYDLSAVAISAPKTVKTESDLTINLTIKNDGYKDVEAGEYTISYYVDGDLIDTTKAEDMPEIKSGESFATTFDYNFGILENGQHGFQYVINYAKDEDLTNNTSVIANVMVEDQICPSVVISGELNENSSVVLTWETPIIDAETDGNITEDFSSISYPSFTFNSFGPWTLECGNETDAVYFVPGPVEYYEGGWILVDPSIDPELQELYSEYGFVGYGDEGSFLAACYHQNGKANDAWLISEELNGKAQTVSFMARSFDSYESPETIVAYYSTTTADRDAFVRVNINGYYGGIEGLPMEWTEYSINLPEGAKYFAIVSTSKYVWATMLDNITYEGRVQTEYADYVIEGYDIYRNGEKIGTAAANATSYVDNTVEDGDYTYQVVVVYDKANSAPSNEVKVTVLGVSDAVAATSTVSVEGRQIVVAGAESVQITAADGKVFNQVKDQNIVRTTVPAGVYVVKTNDQVVKVIVK